MNRKRELIMFKCLEELMDYMERKGVIRTGLMDEVKQSIKELEVEK